MEQSPYLPLLIAVLVFFSVVLFCVSALVYLQQRAQRSKMLEKIEAWGTGFLLSGAGTDEPESFHTRIFDFLGAVGQKIRPKESRDFSELRRRHLDFLRAGIRSERSMAIFWGAKGTLALLLPLIFTGVLFSWLFTPTAAVATSLVLAMAGFYIPDVWLGTRARQRKKQIQRGLPDALDLLIVCVEAGMGLDAAVSRVGEELKRSNPPLSEELKTFNLEMRAGKTRPDALRNLALRTDLEDVNSLVALLIQTDKFGTSVAQALRVYSDTFRTQRMQRAEEVAAKLPIKLIFPLLLFIFPSILAVTIGPAAIRLLRAFASP